MMAALHRIFQSPRFSLLAWALVALVVLALLITTKVILSILAFVVVVLILNGLYHALLGVWNIFLRLLSFAFGATRTVIFAVFPGL